MPSTTVWVSSTTPSPAADSNQHPRQLANQNHIPEAFWPRLAWSRRPANFRLSQWLWPPRNRATPARVAINRRQTDRGT